MSKYDEMSNAQIAYEVARLRIDGICSYMLEGDAVCLNLRDVEPLLTFDPINNPADAWPIIVENAISINAMAGGDFTLCHSHDKFHSNTDDAVYSENPLRAAMICFLKMKDGD